MDLSFFTHIITVYKSMYIIFVIIWILKHIDPESDFILNIAFKVVLIFFLPLLNKCLFFFLYPHNCWDKCSYLDFFSYPHWILGFKYLSLTKLNCSKVFFFSNWDICLIVVFWIITCPLFIYANPIQFSILQHRCHSHAFIHRVQLTRRVCVSWII